MSDWDRCVGDWLGPAGDGHWWQDLYEMERVLSLLLRSGMIGVLGVKYYLEKPWNWTRHRELLEMIRIRARSRLRTSPRYVAWSQGEL